MINFFKERGVYILISLMFPVMWPIYAVYELTHSTRVTYNDCLDVWRMWVIGTLIYCISCAALWVIYQVALMLYADGYLITVLTVLTVPLLLIFVHISAPKIIYYIFKNKKKTNE